MAPAQDIPNDVRSVVLTRIEKAGVDSLTLGQEFLMREGFGSFDDFVASVRERFGVAEADEVLSTMEALAEKDAASASWTGQGLDPTGEQAWMVRNMPRYALIAAPDAVFINGVEYGLELVIERNARPGDVDTPARHRQLVEQVDGLFAKRGIPYRFEEGRILWSGDRGLHDTVTEPALQALADSRLRGARDEYEAALRHLRAGTVKDLEDAIEEAAKSVESALKVLVISTNTPVQPKATVQPLVDALKKAGVIPDYTDNLLQAAARIRNRLGGHGAGSQPRVIDLADATATVNAAASAIVYLAAKLP